MVYVEHFAKGTKSKVTKLFVFQISVATRNAACETY